MILGSGWVIFIVAFVILITSTIIFLASRYKRCPSDAVLVVYGRVGDQTAKCVHGGGTLVWPLIQDCAYLSLTPMTISIPLQNALSLQNIRINVPSTFTVGISTDPDIRMNAAERLLGLESADIENMAREIIFGQLRLTVAALTIEQINQDRESFLTAIRRNVEPELNKIGLYLINVNITDITDASGYIDAIGKKAAAEAINKAMVDVAEQEKSGAVGQASAHKERDIRVAENVAESEKGKKRAEADRRVYVQAQEADAVTGENKAKADIAGADATLAVRKAEAVASSEKGAKHAEADRRIYVQGQEADAIGGENKAKADIANFNAELAIKEAAALQRGEVAKRMAAVEIQKAQYKAEQERLTADQVVKQEIEKRKIEIDAEAEAERIRRVAKGQADGVLMKYEAEAAGLKKLLEGKAQGYQSLVTSCHGDAKSAATLLLIEKLENIVAKQVEAISNLKIDKITVWDSGDGARGSSTANFASSLIKSIPPLHDIAEMAGVELPGYLGKIKADQPAAEQKPEPPPAETGRSGKK